MGESTSTTLEGGTTLEHESGAILFPELVWAHHRWQQETGQGPHAPRNSDPSAGNGSPDRPGDKPSHENSVEQAYRAKLRQFQDSEGEILDVYWCWNEASAVALTAKPRKQFSFRREELEIRLHRATDWATLELPQVAELLHHYDSLAIKTTEILTPTPKRIAMEWIFAEQSYLLGFAEAMRAKSGKSTESHPSQLPKVLGKQRRALKRIEDYYDRAGTSSARIYYFTGMMLGLVVLAVVAAVVGLPLARFTDIGTDELRNYLSTYAAGAIGAVVSVMTRMRHDTRNRETGSQGGFRIDYEVGKAPLLFLGAVRPVLGAVFGTATYFALQSSLVQMEPQSEETAFYFFAILAFLSGFTERFTHVLFGEAEKTVTATLQDEQKRRARTSASEEEIVEEVAPGVS